MRVLRLQSIAGKIREPSWIDFRGANCVPFWLRAPFPPAIPRVRSDLGGKAQSAQALEGGVSSANAAFMNFLRPWALGPVYEVINLWHLLKNHAPQSVFQCPIQSCCFEPRPTSTYPLADNTRLPQCSASLDHLPSHTSRISPAM